MSNGRLAGKVALVTGAASGIGKACAELFSQEGASIAVADRNHEGAIEVADAIDSAGGRAVAVQLDVVDGASCESAVASTLSEFQQVDILVNSAGVGARTGTEGMSYEERWYRVIDINLKGSVLMARAAIEHMRGRGSGAVVNIASIRGLIGYPEFITDGFNPYPHSKGGVVNFTRDMANGVAKSGVRVNAVCPGFTHTDMTRAVWENPEVYQRIVDLHPIGRFAQPEEIAHAALFLASDEASFITGASLVIDGGFTSQ